MELLAQKNTRRGTARLVELDTVHRGGRYSDVSIFKRRHQIPNFYHTFHHMSNPTGSIKKLAVPIKFAFSYHGQRVSGGDDVYI